MPINGNSKLNNIACRSASPAGMPDADKMSLMWPVRYGPIAVPKNVATIKAKADVVARQRAITKSLIVETPGPWPIGPEKFIKDGGAKLLDESHWGKLWKIVLPVDGDDDVEIYMVEVINSSPEPDGSYKTYMLSVAPEDPFGKPMRTALQAVASTFGVSGEEYASGLQRQETLTGSASQT